MLRAQSYISCSILGVTLVTLNRGGRYDALQLQPRNLVLSDFAS